MQQRQFRPISEPLALEWLMQTMTILNEVHAQQFFHRDIKPSNIMLRPDGQLVLIDFGAVRAVTQTYMAKQGAQGVTGIHSMGFTPPEQMNGQAVTQSDFFALGRTFIYLLTGKEPTNPSIYDPYSDQCRWQDIATQVSPPFASLIDEMMARLPKDRPVNTQIILQRLRDLDQGMEQSRQQTEVSRPPIPPPPSESDQSQPGFSSQPPPFPSGTVPPTDIQPPPYTPPPAYAQTSQPASFPNPSPATGAGVPPTDIQAPAYSNPPSTAPHPNLSGSSKQTLEQANQQIKTAWIAGIVSTVFTLIAALALSGEEGGLFNWISALISAGLTFGIYKKNQTCATLMLAYFILAKILQLSVAVEAGAGINPFVIGLGALFIYFFIQGVRGTSAYHKLAHTHNP